jgi:hypothetical protein
MSQKCQTMSRDLRTLALQLIFIFMLAKVES